MLAQLLGSGRHFGRPDPRSHTKCTSTCMPAPSTIRPRSSRQAQLGVGGRVKPGGGASPRCTISTCGTCSEQGGGPVLQAPRPTLGGDSPITPARHGFELPEGHRRCRSKTKRFSEKQSKSGEPSRGGLGPDGWNAHVSGGCNTKKAAVPGADAPAYYRSIQWVWALFLQLCAV